jgi:general secretion pathway protein I
MNHLKSKGFTLIEVMVALVVVALSISALSFQMMGGIDNTAYLRDKTIASWVASNQLELERLANKRSNALLTQEKSGSEEMAGREWFWRVKPLKVALEKAVKLEVSVAATAEGNPLVTLVGISDQYHEQ